MLKKIAHALQPSGLTQRGGIHLTPQDIVRSPHLQGVHTAVLVGNAGGAFWPIFERWRAAHPHTANPLDTWSHQIIGEVARQFGARAVSPSDRPYLPFQQWAMRSEGLIQSPLGILMHPEFGVWHAYRGALLFEAELDLDPVRELIHPCDRCDGKPCKKACPVSAHAGDGFAYQDCLDHLDGELGGDCMMNGCLDRNACPYGVSYRYSKEMQVFIARAFAGLNPRRGDGS